VDELALKTQPAQDRQLPDFRGFADAVENHAVALRRRFDFDYSTEGIERIAFAPRPISLTPVQGQAYALSAKSV
jgi:hypothetical protein